MFRRWLGIVLLLPSLAGAAGLQPGDFAWGRSLQLDGAAPFHRLPLPGDLYSQTAHSDLRDIRVFGQDGSMPFALVPVGEANPAPVSIPLQAFVLPQDEDRSSAGHFSIDGNDFHLNWTRRGGSGQAQLLLDAGEQPAVTLSAIRLRWPEGQDSWQRRVTVDSSDDLRDWTTRAQDLPLLNLRQDEQQLRVDTLEFPPSKARYWRLTLNQDPPPKLVSAAGLLQARHTGAVLNWLQPAGVEPDGDRLVYRFARPVPAAALRIRLPQDNSVLPYTLEYRRTAHEAWRPLPSGVAWRLPQSGRQQDSAPVELGDITIGELRLGSRSEWGTGRPTLELGRRALQLLFNARGQGPWLLAWGSRAAPAAALPPESLIPGYTAALPSTLPLARLGAPVTLGGESRLHDPGPAERQAQWRARALWALLLLGVAVLGGLAVKLWRDLRAKPSST